MSRWCSLGSWSPHRAFPRADVVHADFGRLHVRGLQAVVPVRRALLALLLARQVGLRLRRLRPWLPIAHGAPPLASLCASPCPSEYDGPDEVSPEGPCSSGVRLVS